jgi:hypothetical protein
MVLLDECSVREFAHGLEVSDNFDLVFAARKLAYS